MITKKATKKELGVFFKVVDFRLSVLREMINTDPENTKDSSVTMNSLLDKLQREIKIKMKEWYLENILGEDISLGLMFGDKVDLPPETISLFLEKQCAVCGDTRIFNIAHIIPRHLKGSDNTDNLLRLCANHHFMFDQKQLSEEQLKRIDWSSKNPKSIKYAEDLYKISI